MLLHKKLSNKMKTALMIIMTLIIVFSLIACLGIYRAVHPTKVPNQLTPKDFNLAYEDVSFRTKDGLVLSGWFIPSELPEAKTIILLHGYPADKGDILPSRIFLHACYNLLFFDFRYFGNSEGTYTTIGRNEVLDLLAAIDYLGSRGLHELGVWGLSMGAAVSLMATPEQAEIKALVAEASYARLDWLADAYYKVPGLRYVLSRLARFWAWVFLHFDLNSVSPAEAAEKLTIPILLIHSQNDQVTPFTHALALQKALEHNKEAEVHFIDNTAHGAVFENQEQIVMTFFNKNLPCSSTPK